MNRIQSIIPTISCFDSPLNVTMIIEKAMVELVVTYCYKTS